MSENVTISKNITDVSTSAYHSYLIGRGYDSSATGNVVRSVSTTLGFTGFNIPAGAVIQDVYCKVTNNWITDGTPQWGGGIHKFNLCKSDNTQLAEELEIYCPVQTESAIETKTITAETLPTVEEINSGLLLTWNVTNMINSNNTSAIYGATVFIEYEAPPKTYDVVIHTQGGFSDAYGNKDDIHVSLTQNEKFYNLESIPCTYSYDLVGIFDTQNNEVFNPEGRPTEGVYFDSQGRWVYDGDETVPIELYAIWDKIEFIYCDTKRRVPYSDNQTLPVWEDNLDDSSR